MKELCGTAAEYLDCRILPDDAEASGQEFRFEGGLLKMFGPGASELEQKHIYRPLA
jgi:hypothetical protein